MLLRLKFLEVSDCSIALEGARGVSESDLMHLYFVIYLYTHYNDMLFYSALLEQRILENTGLSL